MSSSISFTGLLTLAFIILKLCGKIYWPWIWVLVPLWAPIAFFVVAGIIAGVAMFLAAIRR